MITESVRQLWRERAKIDLYFLCKFVLGFEDLVPETHAPLCEFISGPEKWKLLVGSRGILKTSICTIGHTIQLILQDPNSRILIMQANEITAKGTVGQIRDLFDNCEILRELFPELQPTPQQKQSGHWSALWITVRRPGTYSESTVRAAGVGTSVVGTHWTHIKRDDIVAATKDNVTQEVIAPSPEDIDKAIGQHKLIRGLFESPKTSRVDDICNRWSVHDFVRYLLDSDPYEDDDDTSRSYMKVSCYKDNDESKGSVWPERFGQEDLDEIERTQGSYFFSTQYICEPKDSSRSVFKRKFLKFYSVEGGTNLSKLPDLDDLRIYAVMDQAQKVSLKACYTACIVVGIDAENNWWILDAKRAREGSTEKIDRVFQLADQWNIYGANVFGIEANLAQGILVDWIEEEQKKRGKILNLHRLKPPNHMSKDMRIEALAPYFEQGRVYIRAGSYQEDLIGELTDFPFGRYRDLIDALAYVHHMAASRRVKQASWQPAWNSLEGIRNRLRSQRAAQTPFELQDKVAV